MAVWSVRSPQLLAAPHATCVYVCDGVCARLCLCVPGCMASVCVPYVVYVCVCVPEHVRHKRVGGGSRGSWCLLAYMGSGHGGLWPR